MGGVGWGQGWGDGTDTRVTQPREVVCTKAGEKRKHGMSEEGLGEDRGVEQREEEAQGELGELCREIPQNFGGCG